MRQLTHLAQRVAELERIVASLLRHGTVEQVDAAKKRVRLRIGENEQGEPFLSPWVPYAQIAGALKVHTPPSAGQQFTLFSPAGDFQQAVAIPLTWSEANPSPSEKGNEHVLTFADVKMEVRDGQTKITVGDAVADIKAGSIELAIGGSGFVLDAAQLQMTQKFVAKGGSRPAHYVGGLDTDGDAAVDGNEEILI